MTGLYIHIPFCKSRCIYCSFCSITQREMMSQYMKALKKEMYCRRNELPSGKQLTTIYIGGGTPSVLTPVMLAQVFKNIDTHFLGKKGWTSVQEITIECNPDDITQELAKLIKQLGVNRVSLGVQTFNNQRLRFLARRHNDRQVIDAVRWLKQAGIDNISIDLIYGFPQQTEDDWAHDIRQALSLQVPHISAYSLTYEEGTPLWRMRDTGKVKDIDEQQYRKLFYMLIDNLKDAGYEHYEISNFALPGKQSRHNSSYWHDIPYIGIGAAAHSYDMKSRRWNTNDVKAYIAKTLTDNTPYETEIIDDNTHFNDLITTMLRTKKGLSLKKITESFPQSFLNDLLNEAQPWIEQKLLVTDNNHLHLTREALFISDRIMSDLVRV